MDVDDAADALYALPPAEFTGSRAERVKAARAAGDRASATAIGALRRPTTAAWLVNQLVRRRPADLGELTDLGAALRAAHQELDGAALRALSARRHALLARLAAGCREVGQNAGHPVSDAVARELEDMFTAALADPAAAATLISGRLSSAKDLEADASPWPASDPDARPRPPAPPAPPAPTAPPALPVRPRPVPPAAERGVAAARAEPPRPVPPAAERGVAAARAELDRRKAALADALATEADTATALDDATEAAAAAGRSVAALRAQLTAAEQHEQHTRQLARIARRASEDAQRRLSDARRRHATAAQRLAALTGDTT
ncbi:MAG: hypothetical protein ACT4O0_07960 [Pseudonocardia sp.]